MFGEKFLSSKTYSDDNLADKFINNFNDYHIPNMNIRVYKYATKYLSQFNENSIDDKHNLQTINYEFYETTSSKNR
jgi:hypothetical protein